MIEAPPIPDDKQRVASLQKLNLLDTPIEARFERITRMACHVLNIPIVAFTLVDDTRQTFKSVQGMQGDDVPRCVSFCSHVVGRDEMLVVPDARLDERFSDNPLVEGLGGIIFYAGCPVHAPDGQKIGSLCAIDTKPHHFTPDQLHYLKDIAAMIETELRAVILSHAQKDLLTELNAAQRASLIDPLTRLWNRDGVTQLLKHEWQQAAEHKTQLALVMADIDHFKMVNDTYGHQVGDEVLKYVVQQFMTALRPIDGVGRMGGEEFLLVLPNSQTTELLLTLENLRTIFEKNPVPTSAGLIPVTISFGAACLMPDGVATIEQVIAAADQALYQAKRLGRNRVEIKQT